MPTTIATLAVTIIEIWFVVGFVFALLFAGGLAARIDARAAHLPIGMRLILIPGAIALWPLLVVRVAAGRRAAPAQHDAHSDAAAASSEGPS